MINKERKQHTTGVGLLRNKFDCIRMRFYHLDNNSNNNNYIKKLFYVLSVYL